MSRSSPPRPLGAARLPLRALATGALFLAGASAARADSATYALTPSWRKIAGAGGSVDVQNVSAGTVTLSTASGGPPGTGAAGQALAPGEHRLYGLTADLYALGTGQVVVTAGLGIAPLANAPSLSTTGSLSAAGDMVLLGVDGMNTGLVQASAGWTGGVVFEVSADGGATWTAVNMIPYAGGASTAGPSAGGLYEMAVGGLTTLRVRATSAITGGPATITLRATNGLKSLRVGNPAANPLTTVSSNPATPLTGQVKIATTGTAVCLPASALVNGIVVKAKASNQAQGGSYSGAVGGTGVTTTYDGTGTGYPLAPGEAMSFAASSSGGICVNGTAGDIFSYGGN